MRKWLALLLFPLTVQAAGEGAWQDSGMGVTLNYRGVFRIVFAIVGAPAGFRCDDAGRLAL